MSYYKAKLADYVTKGKLNEDAHEISSPPSGISPSQPTAKRNLEQELQERKKKSVPSLPQPAMECPSTSLDKNYQSSKTTEALTPSAWFQSKQSNGEIEMKDAPVCDHSHSLPSSSPNAWSSKLISDAPGPSQSYSPAQALAEFHLHWQGSHGSASLSSPQSPLGKPVECAKSGTPAAHTSASAFHLSYDDFPAISNTLPANSMPTWGKKNTQSTAYVKGIKDAMISTASPGYLEISYAHITKNPVMGTVGEALTPNQKGPIPQQPDPSRAISTSDAAIPRQAASTEPDHSLLEPLCEDEQKLRVFIQQMVQHRCPGCDNTGAPFNTGAVFEYTHRILISKQPHPIFKCQHQRCRVYFCPACMKKGKRATALVQRSAGSPGHSTWCCSSARLFFIFLLLCGPHGHPNDNLASLLQDCQVNAKIENPGASKGPSTQARATGCPQHASGSALGTGYGGPGDYANTFSGFTRSADKKDFEVLPGLFAKLQEVWPCLATSSEFDQEPPELLLAMARRSPLMIKVAELLRNDCVEDVVYRATMYQPMFDFIRVVVAHPFSAPLVHYPRVEYPLRRTLLPVCFGPDQFTSPASRQARSASPEGKGKGKALYDSPQDTLQSLVSLLSSLTDQSRAIMHYMNPKNEDAAKIMAMCQRICDFSNDIARPPNVDTAECTKAPGSAHPTTPARASNVFTSAALRVEEAEEKKMADIHTWLSVNKVAEIESDDWLGGYSFSRKLAQTAGAAVKSGRVKRLVYDLSTLRTSLPEGIFVRHHSSRLDAMKVLIVGPEGTPYENGLFEFDLFCPLEYPDVPPAMLFKTTRSGRRVNPNLYIDGKICLSLLGTWDGEPWCPKTSTLLQLLVSIQAMIFCAEPLWNEPGIDSRLETWVSDLYNWEMRADTLIFAMSDWLRARNTNAASGGAVNNPWDEVVGKHFELRWRRILETAIRWEKENDTKVSFERSGLGFIMMEKRAAERFRVGILRLKGCFAEWARTEEDMSLVQIDHAKEGEAIPESVSDADQWESFDDSDSVASISYLDTAE
ncbi:ubiquitin-conjugating enzyme [Colletotrichum graminicola M1.001]|uniref:Ubiquitin-conjugating enzyme n=1 Tax=Colletotrichum graminicola (strain M1.001 / M2 / FGSC 10212) TaxID=645133 RepID=E3Q539_COLGM|nr:ubiquitin-conjugating enzyme [Colletotrichum graminicola M1.001]EFQ25806.1 ubiquitin-conjugating enzyme [Colletotrichum graminicola M1.001]